MIKTGDEKELSLNLCEAQKKKGTYDSPCMSICDYQGVFKECATCNMRKAEKKLWKSADQSMKEMIIRSIIKRTN